MKEIKPAPATTVMIVRNANDNITLEVLMTRRQPYLKFLGDHYVFPGGRVEKQDYSQASIKRLIGFNDLDEACRILNLKNNLDNNTRDIKEVRSILGYWIAGIRELFEETGILLAYDCDNKILIEMNRKFNQYRSQIIKDEIEMTEMMEKEDLYYAGDRFFYYNHFITPKFSPKRFDTRFFICKLPKELEQYINPHEKEISEIIWIRPRDALKMCNKKDGNFKLIFPQIVSLKDLDAFDINLLD
ncbi:MAG: hypothetical protein GF329_11205 [Candidatus Lokiarchaeota archaeon]|nr:hypothetical protein [Candidatus Lokiarchaeota archaeon]